MHVSSYNETIRSEIVGEMWSSCQELLEDPIVKYSVFIDLKEIDELFCDERNISFGVIDIFQTLESQKLINDLIKVGMRRSELEHMLSSTSRDYIFLDYEPSDIDIHWVYQYCDSVKHVRWIAYPSNTKYRVLMTGYHASDCCFGEGWVFGLAKNLYPKHIVDCYSMEYTRRYSSTEMFPAFDVDNKENVEEAIDYMTILEIASECLMEMWNLYESYFTSENSTKLLCRDTNSHTDAWDCITHSSGWVRCKFKKKVSDFVEAYNKLRQHNCCTSNSSIWDAIEHYDYKVYRMLKGIRSAGITMRVLEKFLEEE